MTGRQPLNQLPLRDALTPQKDEPAGSAWFWGPEDQVWEQGHKLITDVSNVLTMIQLGRLNLQTPERVRAAAAHVRSGTVIPLK